MDNDKVLKMTLRKEFALQIVKGEKVREYRAFSNFWARRLCVFEDPDDPYLATGLKEYQMVHFYPYNQKWFVDCEIIKTQWVTVDEAFLQEYGTEVEARLDDLIFVIHLGKVIDTNLEIEEK